MCVCASQAGAPIAEPSYVSVDDLRRRKHKAVTQAKEAIAQIGVGVTADAQRVFDSLAKTMQCRWEGDSIVVLDMVTLRYVVSSVASFVDSTWWECYWWLCTCYDAIGCCTTACVGIARYLALFIVLCGSNALSTSSSLPLPHALAS